MFTSIFKGLKYFIGGIIIILSLPFLFFGVIGMWMLFSTKYFGYIEDDFHVSGTFRGMPKN